MVAVNGRFLRSRPSGMHHVGRALLDAAAGLGFGFDVLAPAGIEDARVSRVVPGPPSKAGDLVWEQTSLPWAARGEVLLSLANTAPVLCPRNAVLVHDLAPVVGREWFGGSMRGYARLVLGVARRAPLVLAVSQAVADELVDVGVRRSRIVVVRNAVGSQFRPAPDVAVEDVRERHGLSGPYLLMVGWADPRKDIRTAVRAHLDAAGVAPHELVVVGQTHGTFAAVDVPTAPSVRFLGYVNDDDMVPLLTGAAGLVYPSRYEGFGLPPVEAIACGTPALVSDLPVLRETAQGQATYVSVGDVDAWSAAMVRAVKGELAVPQLEPWTWEDAANVLIEALGRLA